MNSGQRLVALSGLQSGSAASHFLAIVQGTGTGTGTGSTVIAYRSDVLVSTPTTRIALRQLLRDMFQAPESMQLMEKPRSKKYVYATTCVKHAEVFTSADEIYVTTITESTEI